MIMIKLEVITDKEIRLIRAEYWILLPKDFINDTYWKIRSDSDFSSQFDYFYQYIEDTLRDKLRGGTKLQKYIIMGENLYFKNHKRTTRNNLLKVFSGTNSMVTIDSLPEYYYNTQKDKTTLCYLYFKESDLENLFDNHGLSMNIILFIAYFLKDKLGLQTQMQE